MPPPRCTGAVRVRAVAARGPSYCTCRATARWRRALGVTSALLDLDRLQVLADGDDLGGGGVLAVHAVAQRPAEDLAPDRHLARAVRGDRLVALDDVDDLHHLELAAVVLREKGQVRGRLG